MQSTSGFSLLELLIVMAIVAILTAAAYPPYSSHLVKARRNQAEIGLVYLASQLESFYGLQNTYQGATLESLGISADTDDHSYRLAIQSTTELSYQITATPIGQQGKADTACGILSLNERGEKSASTAVATCWN